MCYNYSLYDTHGHQNAFFGGWWLKAPEVPTLVEPGDETISVCVTTYNLTTFSPSVPENIESCKVGNRTAVNGSVSPGADPCRLSRTIAFAAICLPSTTMHVDPRMANKRNNLLCRRFIFSVKMCVFLSSSSSFFFRSLPYRLIACLEGFLFLKGISAPPLCVVILDALFLAFQESK